MKVEVCTEPSTHQAARPCSFMGPSYTVGPIAIRWSQLLGPTCVP